MSIIRKDLFEIDVKRQRLTGIVKENAAQLMMKKLDNYNSTIGVDSTKKKERCIAAALEHVVEMGLTCVNTNDQHSFHLYKTLDEKAALDVRVNLVSDYTEIGARKPYVSSSGMFTNRRVKIFSDGALGANTAALKVVERPLEETDKEPIKTYVGFDGEAQKYTGILLHKDFELVNIYKDAIENGYQIETHAIGDAAAEQVIHAIETAFHDKSESGVPMLSRKHRPHMTHCQVLSSRLVSKMAELGVIANIQGSFVPTDSAWIESRLQPPASGANKATPQAETRLDYSYCWNTMLQQGVYLAGSSDAPIESANPFKGMFDLIFRPKKHSYFYESLDELSTEEESYECFQSKERIQFFQALNLYTIAASFASFDEKRLGRIEPGYCADFVVIDQDVNKEPWLLRSVTAREVWVGGKLRHSQDSSGVNREQPENALNRLLPGKNGPRHSERLLQEQLNRLYRKCC